jgi:hypothetical protein
MFLIRYLLLFTYMYLTSLSLPVFLILTFQNNWKSFCIQFIHGEAISHSVTVWKEIKHTFSTETHSINLFKYRWSKVMPVLWMLVVGFTCAIEFIRDWEWDRRVTGFTLTAFPVVEWFIQVFQHLHFHNKTTNLLKLWYDLLTCCSSYTHVNLSKATAALYRPENITPKQIYCSNKNVYAMTQHRKW